MLEAAGCGPTPCVDDAAGRQEAQREDLVRIRRSGAESLRPFFGRCLSAVAVLQL